MDVAAIIPMALARGRPGQWHDMPAPRMGCQKYLVVPWLQWIRAPAPAEAV